MKEKDITTLLAGMLSQEVLGNEYKKKFDKIYPELAEKHQISFLPFLLDGVALNTELNLSDGKHPNQKGIKIISIFNKEKNLEKKLTI